MKKSMKKMISILLAVVMIASMFSVLPISASAAVFENYAYTQTTNSDGFVNTFISEPFCDDKITDEEAAYNCVMSVIDRIGGSSTTELELDYIQPNENGMTVVSYSQRAGQMLVYGSTVKLIVDKDDNAIGLVSSISPDVEVKPIEEWAVNQTQAEKIVTDQIAASGSEGTVLEGDSERAVIPSMTQIGRFICVWVVYTYDISKGMDDYAYKAHYVTAEGEYLYSVSVSNPSDPDALSGQSAKELFDFDAYESGETQVTVNGAGGSTKEVTVPTLKDTKTGKVYLADRERKIVCADTADMFFRNTLTPTEAVNVHPVDASVYYNYIRVWDYYNSVGWTGPDGKGTPTLLLMNYVDQTGEPVANACYLTKMNGFQLFAWTREMNFGACLDVVGHEFTHCVTTSTMKYNIYKNDPGAINEGYSDIMGSLIEIRLDGETDGAWKIAENLGAPIRNMADPHEYAQPEFAFDTYYAPNASVPTGANDKGGVHINASLLALCAVKLHEAGMTPREQSYFWLNSALVISPQTDYPMMAEILPWLMKQLGYDKYLDTLNQTIKDAKFTATEASAVLPEGCGAATFDFSDYADLAEKGRVNIFFFKSPEFDINKRSGTWPVPGSTVAQATLPAGEYVVLVGLASPDGATVKRGILTEEGWKFCEDITPDYFAANGTTVTVNEGETTVVPNDGFRPVAVEILNIVDPDYVLPEPQPESEIILGDVDGDGTVTIVDATYIQRRLADLPTDSFVEAAADADQDGMITIIDATFIQRWLADLPSNENIGKPIKENPVLTYCSKSAIDHLGYDNMAMLYNLISDDILPQVVSQLTTAFPTFIETDGGKAIGERIGLVIYTSEFPDSVASSKESLAYVSGFPIGTESYICMLGVNALTLFEKDPKTGTYTFKESERANLENTVIHEMMHAFMNDYVRAGNTTDKTNNYPGWFCEGIASAVENVYTFRYDQYSKIYGYSRENGESAEVCTDDLLKFYKEYSEVYPVEGGPTHVPDIGTSDDDGNRISAYTMGYLATLYLSYLAQADNPTDYSSFSAGEFRTGLNTIFSLLHSGHTLDEVISSISGGMYKNTDDFTAKFVKGENGDGTNGKGESVTAEVSLGFCVSYLNYLGEVTTQLQKTDSNATANGSILLPLDTAEKSPIKAQAPEGAKENQQYFNIYRDPRIEEEDQPYVYSTVDPAIAYQSGGKTYTTKSVPVLRNSLDSTETATLRVYGDQPNVPYVNVRDFYNQFYLVNTDLKDGMTCTASGGRYTLTNIAGTTATFDVDADTIYTTNLEEFATSAYTLQVGMAGGVDENHPFIKMDEVNEPADPTPMTLRLSDYGIDLRGDETGVYAPLATVSDIFASAETYRVVCTGKKIYTADYTGAFVPTPAIKTDPDYVADVEVDHPADLADFTYRELCFNIDLWYGQPGQEWVHDDLQTMKLDELLTTKYPDIKEKLCSAEFATYYTGLMNLVNGILFDGGHTTVEISPLFAGDIELTSQAARTLLDKDYAQKFVYAQKDKPTQTAIRTATRDAAYGDNYYLEQGDTAMIHFDSFVTDFEGWKAFYAGTGERPLKFNQGGKEIYDTVGVVLSGLERAKKNPAIKNIIIDMSCNGGGDSGAMHAIEWLMTGKGYITYANRLTGCNKTESVQFDMNFDGKFDENDVSPYLDYNYGILTSNYAFSCGNAYPWFMHEHGAMILGQKSSGGACAIRITSAAGVEFACSAASSHIVSESGENVDFGCPLDADLMTDGENPYENFYDLTLLSQKMNEFFAAG